MRFPSNHLNKCREGGVCPGDQSLAGRALQPGAVVGDQSRHVERVLGVGAELLQLYGGHVSLHAGEGGGVVRDLPVVQPEHTITLSEDKVKLSGLDVPSHKLNSIFPIERI